MTVQPTNVLRNVSLTDPMLSRLWKPPRSTLRGEIARRVSAGIVEGFAREKAGLPPRELVADARDIANPFRVKKSQGGKSGKSGYSGPTKSYDHDFSNQVSA